MAAVAPSAAALACALSSASAAATCMPHPHPHPLPPPQPQLDSSVTSVEEKLLDVLRVSVREAELLFSEEDAQTRDAVIVFMQRVAREFGFSIFTDIAALRFLALCRGRYRMSLALGVVCVVMASKMNGEGPPVLAEIEQIFCVPQDEVMALERVIFFNTLRFNADIACPCATAHLILVLTVPGVASAALEPVVREINRLMVHPVVSTEPVHTIAFRAVHSVLRRYFDDEQMRQLWAIINHRYTMVRTEYEAELLQAQQQQQQAAAALVAAAAATAAVLQHASTIAGAEDEGEADAMLVQRENDSQECSASSTQSAAAFHSPQTTTDAIVFAEPTTDQLLCSEMLSEGDYVHHQQQQQQHFRRC